MGATKPGLGAITLAFVLATAAWEGAGGTLVRAGTQTGTPAAPGQKVFSTVSPRQAKQLVEARRDLLIVDVRSPEEFQGGSLPGALPIPFWAFLKGQYQLPKEQPLLLVCAVGGRSLAVGRYLSLQGYREVYNLEGGLENWAQQGVPLPRR